MTGLLSAVLLAAGFVGAGAQDWRSRAGGPSHEGKGVVSGLWLVPQMAGLLAYAVGGISLLGFAFGAGLLAFGGALFKLRLLGGADVVPIAISGLVLGFWAFVPLLSLSVGSALYFWRTGRRTAPALAFISVGFVGALGVLVL